MYIYTQNGQAEMENNGNDESPVSLVISQDEITPENLTNLGAARDRWRIGEEDYDEDASDNERVDLLVNGGKETPDPFWSNVTEDDLRYMESIINGQRDQKDFLCRSCKALVEEGLVFCRFCSMPQTHDLEHKMANQAMVQKKGLLSISSFPLVSATFRSERG